MNLFRIGGYSEYYGRVAWGNGAMVKSHYREAVVEGTGAWSWSSSNTWTGWRSEPPARGGKGLPPYGLGIHAMSVWGKASLVLRYQQSSYVREGAEAVAVVGIHCHKEIRAGRQGGAD